MKGLTLTLLLATLELAAVMTGRSDLMADGSFAPSRKEEAGIQSEVIVDAERAEIVEPGQAEAAGGKI